MPRLFPRWSNIAFPSLVALLFAVAAAAVISPLVYVRTPYNTARYAPLTQPVEFDHRHHVRDDGIDCLYCHPGAETSARAGIPSTEVCMGCHVQVWSESPLLEPVRRSYFSGKPIPWRRVHRLPDFVHFDHSAHVGAGVGCVRCHGRVDLMAAVHTSEPLTMSWCLDCHRAPREQLVRAEADSVDLRTASNVFVGSTEPEALEHHSTASLTTCTTCHR